jgi:acyl dehydratase
MRAGEVGMTEPDGHDGGDRLYYLDDLRIGQRFSSGEHVLDATQIKAFAAQYDPQPFHLDEEAARGSLFGGLAASGWHTAAITMRLLVGGGAPIAGGVIGAGGEIAWPRPTRAGDVLRVESEVLEVTPSRSRPERGTVTLRSETRNQRGEGGAGAHGEAGRAPAGPRGGCHSGVTTGTTSWPARLQEGLDRGGDLIRELLVDEELPNR